MCELLFRLFSVWIPCLLDALTRLEIDCVMSQPSNVVGAYIDRPNSCHVGNDHAGPHTRSLSRNSALDQRNELLLGQDIIDRPTFDDRRTTGLGLTGLPQPSEDHSSLSRRNITYTNLTPDIGHLRSRSREDEILRGDGQPTPETETRRWLTPDSSRNSLAEHEVHYEDVSDQVHLIDRHTTRVPDSCCPTHGELLKEKVSWLSIVFIALAVFSWVGSGAFFGIAIARPKWGHRIGPNKSMTYETATFLCAFFSKLVEITFACSYVAALGQFLSRKAFPKNSPNHIGRGISLAEINLRLWILQPGTLITHWEGAKYVITTFLGIVTLAAAVSAMFYTSSVEALVSPKLRFGQNVTRPLYGQVMTSFANNDYLGQTCQTSISSSIDPIHGGSTCLQISFAGNGFHNFETWQAAWRARQRTSNPDPSIRPLPIAALYENTTVHGQWIRPSGEDFTADSAKHGRLVLNVTMAMPNANVFRAAREPTNGILQPEDLGGAGQYYMRAAVPVPAVNTLCVGASLSELVPLVGNETNPPGFWRTLRTPLDPFFGWSNNPDQITTSYHPWFGKLPIIFNSVGNTTSPFGLRHIYFLAKPPPETKTMDYILCGIRVFQYSDCSTSLFVARAGSDLSVYCDKDKQNQQPYLKTGNTTNPIPLAVEEKTWTYFGAEWIRSLALTHGISDGNASSARLLTQMIPPWSNTTRATLPVDTPTVAEALCVLSGHTLLLSSDSAPFHHFWNYTNARRLQVPTLQSFQGLIAFRDYVSGGSHNWEGIFYIILAIVFVLNCVCVALLLMYYCKYGEITDYTEPQNLFALAINSPPSQTLAGSCGSGPSGKMLGQRWCVDMQTTSDKSKNSKRESGAHFYVRYPEEEPLAATTSVQNTPDPAAYPRTNRFSRFLSNSSPRNDSPILMDSMKRAKTTPAERGVAGVDDSPAVAQYMKLVGRE